MEKMCVICGKKLGITLYKDKSYRGGHYFGKIIPRKGKTDGEYWECDKCYREAKYDSK